MLLGPNAFVGEALGEKSYQGDGNSPERPEVDEHGLPGGLRFTGNCFGFTFLRSSVF